MAIGLEVEDVMPIGMQEPARAAALPALEAALDIRAQVLVRQLGGSKDRNKIMFSWER